MRKFLLCLFSFTTLANSQPVSVGVIGGVPISDAFETFRGNASRYATNTKRYLVGPTVSFHLPARFALEIDGIYRRLGYEYQQAVGSNQIITSTVANSWEFPALVKWEIIPEPVRPFVDVGGVVRHISGIRQVKTGLGQIGEIDNAVEFNKRNDIGMVFGAGLTFKAGPIRIGPEFRYTRWGSETFRDPVGALLRTNRNQGDFLIAFTF